jgi:hypothetical protein
MDLMTEGKMNGGDEGEGLWLMCFIFMSIYIYSCVYMYEIEQ